MPVYRVPQEPKDLKMNFNSQLSILLLGAMAVAQPIASAQQATQHPSAAAVLPSFEVATIKPVDPAHGGAMGFYSRPGGRVFLGFANAKTIISYAFDVQGFQIAGGPEWVSTDRYNIEAIPPDSAQSRTAKQPPLAATPSSEQRLMLQSLLRDRFGLRYHRETREGAVYILTRDSGKLQLQEPKDKDGDARGAVMMKQGGIADGEAFGENISIQALAESLSDGLHLPVLDQTGITGRYDFHLDPVDPENHDYAAAIFDAMHRLGLNLKRGKGPIQTLVIDHIEKPSEN
jgi:uncharacterized protein (TIGR03435 family)